MALLRAISQGDPVSLLALEGLEMHAPFLRSADWYNRANDADRVKTARQGTDKTKITRSLNEDNTATPPTPAYSTVAKKLVSFDAKVDVTVEDRGEDAETELAYQTRLEAEEASWVLQNMFFEGDSGADAEDFDGLRNMVDAGSILTGGVALPVGNSDSVRAAQQVAIETLLQTAARVIGGASHMYMNEQLKIRWVTIAKNLGYYNQIQRLDQMIDTIGGIQIEGAGYQEDGTMNLPFTETGSSSSIFFVRWGERSNLSLLSTVGVKGRYAGQLGNFMINNVNLDAAFVLQSARALWQSTGWTLSAL